MFEQNNTPYTSLRRKIHHHLWLLNHLIEYQKNQTNLEFIAMLLDQEKAFDQIEHFLLDMMRKYDLGPDFMRWVEILYKRPTCKINVNGHISEKINIKRGIRQGCPLSMLFLLSQLTPYY